MPSIRQNNTYLQSRIAAKRGYTLIIALIFTVAFATIMAFVTDANQRADRDRKIYAIGWQLNQIAKAARLYVRNNSISQYVIDSGADGIPDSAAVIAAETGLGGGVDDGVVDNNFEKTALSAMAAADREITVDDLINAGYLPVDFGQTNSSNEHVTSLGQRIRIFADLSPIGGDPNLDKTVSTAYVVVEDSARSSMQDMILVSQALQSLGTTVTAPLYNGATNISDNCDTSPAIAIWDTGCMNDDDYELLTTDVFDNAVDVFVAGTLVIPSWKAAPHDERSVMRFPQPENFGYATMLTDLYMGACDTGAGNIMVNSIDTGSTTPTKVDSALCRPLADNPTTNEDNRVAIFNIADLNAARIIATDQRFNPTSNTYVDVQTVLDGSSGGLYSEGEHAITNDTLDIETTGDNFDYDDVAVFTALDITGDVHVFNDTDYDFSEEGTYARGYHAANSLSVESRVFVSNPEAGLLANAVVGGIDAEEMNSLSTNFDATAAGLVTSMGIDGGVNSLGEDSNELNGSVINVANGMSIDDTFLDAGYRDVGADQGVVGLTAGTINANGSTFDTTNADIIGTLITNTAEVTSAEDIIDGNSAVIADLTVSGGNVAADNVTIGNYLSVTNTSNLNGTTNMELCTGDCPDILVDPDAPL